MLKMGLIYIFYQFFSAIEDMKDHYQGSTIIGNTTVAENASSILTRFIPEIHNDLVFDFFGLVRSNFLVCTFSSNFCRLVYEYKLATVPLMDLYEAMSLDLNPFGDFDRKYIANHKRIFTNEESLNFQKGDTIYVHKTKRVTCHVSRVTCHMSHFFYFYFFFGQNGEAYRWRVCYQRGLPRLVCTDCRVNFGKTNI